MDRLPVRAYRTRMVRLSDYAPLPIAVDETSRVLALDVVHEYPDAMAWADATFRGPGCRWTFRKHQAEALYVMHRHGGGLFPIGVGDGKTLIFFLASAALGAERAVGMMPPRDVAPYLREIERYKDAGFVGWRPTEIVPYSTLSSINCSELLDGLRPDAIIADEVHSLANASSARTRRFLRYMEEHPATKFVGMSGTLYSTSVADCAHLASLALRDGSPLPKRGAHLDAWMSVLDVGDEPSRTDLRWFMPVVDRFGPDPSEDGGLTRTAARIAARNRFVTAPGVVSTDKLSCDLPLTLRVTRVEPPEAVEDVIAEARETQLAPDGEFIDNPDMMALIVRDMATGFYHQWDWSNVPGGRNEDWLLRRRAWMSAVRSELATPRAGYDSPGLVERTVADALAETPSMVETSQLHWIYSKFREMDDICPERRTVWISKYLVDWADERRAELEASGRCAIFWYDSRCVAEELAARGWSVYGEGTDLEGPERMIAASWHVHGQARRLHEWNTGVVLELPGSGKIWEQLLGRMHRAGQTRPVEYELVVNKYTRGTLGKVREHAEFIQSQTGPQRLLHAVWV